MYSYKNFAGQVELKQLVQLFSEKSHQEILNSFDDNDLLSAEPKLSTSYSRLPFYPRAIKNVTFTNSLNHIDTDRDMRSGIFCATLWYMF